MGTKAGQTKGHTANERYSGSPLTKPSSINKRLFISFFVVLMGIGGAAVYFSIASSRYQIELKKQIRINGEIDKFKPAERESGLGIIDEDSSKWLLPGRKEQKETDSSKWLLPGQTPLKEKCHKDWVQQINETLERCSSKVTLMSESDVENEFISLHLCISGGGANNVSRCITELVEDDFQAYMNCILHDVIMRDSLLMLIGQYKDIGGNGIQGS